MSYDVEVADSKEQVAKPVDKNTENKNTLDQLAEKREVTVEQKAKEEAEAKKAAEEKAVVDAKLKQEAKAEVKKVTETKVTEDAKLKQEVEAKAKEAEVKAKAEKEAEAKKAAELKAKQEADAKAKAAKEAEAKKAAEAKQTTTVAGGLPEVTAAELADPAMNGLTPHTKKMKVALAKKFGITNFSQFRAGDDDGTGHGHNSGMAVDFMVYSDSAKGDQLAEYLTKHMDELGVYYIIWKQRFYMPQQNIYGPANTWNIMPNRGGVTANHYDHVHVSFKK